MFLANFDVCGMFLANGKRMELRIFYLLGAEGAQIHVSIPDLSIGDFSNTYGDGNASEKITDIILKTIN